MSQHASAPVWAEAQVAAVRDDPAARLALMYEWSAEELGEPRLLEFIRDGNPIYACPFDKRHVWRSRHMPFAARALSRVTRPSIPAI